MAHLLLRIRRLIPVAALALAGFAGIATPAPAALAAGGPALSLIGQGGGVYVAGTGFTPGVSVRVEVLNSSLTAVGSTQYLTPRACYYGGCFETVLSAGFTGSAYVAADQAGQSTTWAQTTIYHDPYITAYAESGPSSTTFVVSGSGYTPNATVTVKAEQICGRWCVKVLATQSVTASHATSGGGVTDADYGLIYAASLTVPSHSGTVNIITTGGAPAPGISNVVTLSVP